MRHGCRSRNIDSASELCHSHHRMGSLLFDYLYLVGPKSFQFWAGKCIRKRALRTLHRTVDLLSPSTRPRTGYIACSGGLFKELVGQGNVLRRHERGPFDRTRRSAWHVLRRVPSPVCPFPRPVIEVKQDCGCESESDRDNGRLDPLSCRIVRNGGQEDCGGHPVSDCRSQRPLPLGPHRQPTQL